MGKTVKRMIHSSIWESDQFVSLNARQRLTYIGLISIADDEGRLRGNPALLKSKIYPMDDGITSGTIESDLQAVEGAGLIIRYSVNGAVFIQHPNWEEYQNIRNDLFKPSKWPAADERNETVTKPLRTGNGNVTLTKHNLTKHNLKKTFDRFWSAYPRKVAKQKCFEIWKRRKLGKKIDEILEGLERYKRSEQWTKDGGQFIPNPSTFLNQNRWEDEVQPSHRGRHPAPSDRSQYENL